jgi:hypothetical protein
MKITDFNKAISEEEGKKVEVNIAQISEITRIINKLTKGRLYSIIKGKKTPKKHIVKQIENED